MKINRNLLTWCSCFQLQRVFDFGAWAASKFCLARWENTNNLIVGGAGMVPPKTMAAQFGPHFNIYSLRISGSSVTYRINNVPSPADNWIFGGVPSPFSNLTLPLTMPGFWIGASFTGDVGLNGDIRELAIYGSALSAEQMDAVYAQMIADWGVPLLTPSPALPPQPPPMPPPPRPLPVGSKRPWK